MARCFIICALLYSSAGLANEAINTNSLSKIKDKITLQQSLLAQQQHQRQQLTKLLRSTDQKIAVTANSMFKTQQQEQVVAQQQQQLLRKKKALQSRKSHQQQALAQQIKSAYMTGNNDLLKLLLNQQQSSKTERLLGYYHYLNKARMDSLSSLQQTLIDLRDVEDSMLDTLQQLAKLKLKQQQAQQVLSRQKKQRANDLEELRLSYLKNSEQLEQYQLSELDIKQLLAQQTKRKSATRTLTGLSKVTARLKRPTVGKIIHKFGQPRQGQLRWKGLTISGREGQSVNAVYHGQVIFSDWLKGFGLVLVLDHGDGYMSLYGHNQALLKKAGDFVEQNEAIALLGQSGGQSHPGLYFEIRHKGNAINPTRWFSS